MHNETYEIYLDAGAESPVVSTEDRAEALQAALYYTSPVGDVVLKVGDTKRTTYPARRALLLIGRSMNLADLKRLNAATRNPFLNTVRYR